ncbi:hypothetical protein ACWKTS_26660 [Bacillus toyonensis]|uniref:hypothetical protein n=1 Tax=Bacillus toyonensis TaxID=155322 RepID=UPI000BF0F47A|nr:hypothetical protein [Bacillus toyonensis]PEJ98798.1 hypothetical protein CN688_05535 [Bacillus toyonensis]PEL24686.1 hypothetical protein CN624_17855 [Bacillus toyonensis]
MSFVSVIQTEKFLTVVSDGQVTNESDKTIIQKDYKKFKKISPNQYIAFAGSKGWCELLLEDLPFKEKGHNLEQIVSGMKESISKLPFELGKSLLSVGGVNEDEKLVIYKLSNQEDTEIDRVQASGDGISYALLYNGSMEERVGRSLEKVLLEYIREIGYNTPNKAIRIQRKLNNYIADVDDSVNKITFNLMIKHP